MSYWQDRAASTQTKLSNKKIAQIEKQLAKYYRRAAVNCIEEFIATYNHLLATLDANKLPTPADLYKLDKYWVMQGKLKAELNKLGSKEIDLLTKAFTENFINIYEGIAVQGATAFTTVDEQAARQLINAIWCADGKSWSERIWQNTAHLADTLNDELINIVATGKKPTELKNILQERFNVSYSQADALVRTEVAHIQTEAAKKRYEDYGIQKVQIWADADERRCDVCGKLHEKVFYVGEAIPIPAHPRCRCCIIPLIED